MLFKRRTDSDTDTGPIRQLTDHELDHVGGGAEEGYKLGSKPGGVTDGRSLFTSKPGGVGDGMR